ncbi:UDP-glucose--hexose-1-phosphate uridylyltransferase [Jeotgalibaca sp. A122]|uniref:UDP-glucose--hexose-1-phosphate uridylyltransferase n=1 Tax=Jeotgalibaca sp. A122 TaxID=3457322 RepID=UPI003FD485C0
MSIDQIIQDFVTKGSAIHRIHVLDYYYAVNRLLQLLHLDHFNTDVTPSIPLPKLLDSMDRLVDYATEQKIIADTQRGRDEFEAQIMDILTPLPSTLNKDFWDCYQEAPMRATDEFYQLCRDNDYIKTRQIAKNEQFNVSSPYGDLIITINLSKPEKSKQDILEAQKSTDGYPKCQLCAENEGYKGRPGIAGRTNHRVIRVPILGENWGFQYSPYAYYNEHCIVFTKKHISMNVGHHTIQNLMELTTVFPHYFMGSNAGLPIVGGSMLGHEHYQGGRHHFPMENAKVLDTWTWKTNSNVTAERLYWPLSVVRLRAHDKEDILQAGSELMEAWDNYSNEALQIKSHTNDEKHNAVTLIARRNGSDYELDVVLRNNRTTEEFPDGIFHPHPDVQHIKKENIGLIEVLGLAILPPRLKTELAEVEAFILGANNNIAPYHQEWAEELKQQGTITKENAATILKEAVGHKFQRVLEDAGVFKQTKEGQMAFAAFIADFQA